MNQPVDVIEVAAERLHAAQMAMDAASHMQASAAADAAWHRAFITRQIAAEDMRRAERVAVEIAGRGN